MGSGETNALNGPIYPFDDSVTNSYRLRHHNANVWPWSSQWEPCWDESVHGEDYADYGEFPGAGSGIDDYSYRYTVLEDSIAGYGVDVGYHRIMMLGVGEDPSENDPDNAQLKQSGSYTPSMFFYCIPPDAADNDDNHAFVQFWHYETASYSPYDNELSQGGDQTFNHDGDWEMVQLCVQLKDVDQPGVKTEWLQPWAATASQHYYGQTLAWRRDSDGSGSSAEDQRLVEHAEGDSTGNRFKVFISQGAHATYFRKGEIDSGAADGPGTQVQYDNNPDAGRDAIEEPLLKLADDKKYQLLPLLPKSGAGIFDWDGRWGSFHNVSWLGHDAPPSPNERAGKNPVTGANHVNMSQEPLEFHKKCRKDLGLGLDPLTEINN